MGPLDPVEMEHMAGVPLSTWFKKLNPWQKGGAYAVGLWLIQQSANYAYKAFLDSLIASPELAAIMESINAVLTDRLVLGLVIASAIYAFGPTIYRWIKKLDIEITYTYWKLIRPKPVSFRVVRQAEYVDVTIWAEFENKHAEYSEVLRVHGWRAQIGGQAPDYTQPIPTASPLMPGESQFVRFPRIRIPYIGPNVSGTLEVALLIGSEGAKPRFGLYYKVDFEFEEYGDALKLGQVSVVEMVPQDRIELVYKSASRIRKIREDKGLIIPGIPGSVSIASESEPTALQALPSPEGPSS